MFAAPASTAAPQPVDGSTPVTAPDPNGLPSMSEPDPEIVIGQLENGLRYFIRDNDRPERSRRDAIGGRRRLRARGRHARRWSALPRAHAAQRHRGVPRERTHRGPTKLRRRIRGRHQRLHRLRRDGLPADDADRTILPSSTPASTYSSNGSPPRRSTRPRSRPSRGSYSTSRVGGQLERSHLRRDGSAVPRGSAL